MAINCIDGNYLQSAIGAWVTSDYASTSYTKRMVVRVGHTSALLAYDLTSGGLGTSSSQQTIFSVCMLASNSATGTVTFLLGGTSTTAYTLTSYYTPTWDTGEVLTVLVTPSSSSTGTLEFISPGGHKSAAISAPTLPSQVGNAVSYFQQKVRVNASSQTDTTGGYVPGCGGYVAGTVTYGASYTDSRAYTTAAKAWATYGDSTTGGSTGYCGGTNISSTNPVMRMPGYKPIGVVGHDLNNRHVSLNRAYISDISYSSGYGTCTLNWMLYNPYSNKSKTAAATNACCYACWADIYILWGKKWDEK